MPPNNRTVEMGDEVTLLCRATGFPRPVLRYGDAFLFRASAVQSYIAFKTLQLSQKT